MSNEGFGLISVIMAAYNAEKTIGFAIESVLKQTYKKFELIIIDGGSVDNTESIVKEYSNRDPRIKLIRNSSNSGVSFSRKAALDNSSGDWIAILDSDDAWMPEKLKEQIDLQLKTNADIVYTGVSYIDESGVPFNWALDVPEKIGYKKLLKQNIITNSSALVRKNLILEHYVSGDSMHEDFALWLRLLKAGYSAVGVNETLTIYRVSRGSKSGNKLKSAVMNWKTYKYIGLNFFASVYYMMWYTINGVLKYRHLK